MKRRLGGWWVFLNFNLEKDTSNDYIETQQISRHIDLQIKAEKIKDRNTHRLALIGCPHSGELLCHLVEIEAEPRKYCHGGKSTILRSE
jgi:hypothetical protein